MCCVSRIVCPHRLERAVDSIKLLFSGENKGKLPLELAQAGRARGLATPPHQGCPDFDIPAQGLALHILPACTRAVLQWRNVAFWTVSGLRPTYAGGTDTGKLWQQGQEGEAA
jgi:hypothetical protein